ncbi:MAG: hypothetical protein JWM05_1138 [Acidimicrobiales bacterium]|nr:hypothetical protein [Acidimicrobiales bacterium]
MSTCSHLNLMHAVLPSSAGCYDCLRDGRQDWLHLRLCQSCGHVGCCDGSPGLHARHHAAIAFHPLVRSYEPGETWFWCYVDEVAFELAAMPAGPSHPPPAEPSRGTWPTLRTGAGRAGAPRGRP